MPNDAQALLVLTSETTDYIIAKGGSGDWVLSPIKAGTCKYVVCCRKPAWSNRKEGIAHRAAFLIGLIAGLQKQSDSENERGQPRFLIEISEYAIFEPPKEGVWKESRNPISYKTIKACGLDLRELNFKPMPPRSLSTKGGFAGEPRMTIADAKKALAVSFGVTPEDIEIIIRG